MSWNNGYERAKFNVMQKKQVNEYRKLGMTEEQLEAIHKYDLEQFKSNRRFYMHTQPFEPFEFDALEDCKEKLSILKKYSDVLTVTINDGSKNTRYSWIDEIDNAKLAKVIKDLEDKEIEMLTLVVFDGYSKIEAANIMGLPYHTFKYRFLKIKRKLQKK